MMRSCRMLGAERLSWLSQSVEAWKQPYTERYKDRIVEHYGSERGGTIAYVEVLEISEYATPLDEHGKRRLFPFVP